VERPIWHVVVTDQFLVMQVEQIGQVCVSVYPENNL